MIKLLNGITKTQARVAFPNLSEMVRSSFMFEIASLTHALRKVIFYLGWNVATHEFAIVSDEEYSEYQFTYMIDRTIEYPTFEAALEAALIEVEECKSKQEYCYSHCY